MSMGSERDSFRESDTGPGETEEDKPHHQSTLKTGTIEVAEVNDEVFDLLVLPEGAAQAAQSAWNQFLSVATSKEAAGEALYAALFEASPVLQSLFKTPRAVMALRFMTGISSIIMKLEDPPALKVLVETLGFQHLDIEVTTPRVAIFRDAILDLLSIELGAKLTHFARDALANVLNYVGGALIYIRTQYADRIRKISHSWAIANHREEELEGDDAMSVGSGPGEEEAGAAMTQEALLLSRASSEGTGSKRMDSKERADNKGKPQKGATKVPTNFPEMFAFNAAVMGFGNQTWMKDVLSSFENIVQNVSNSYRLSEECDVLAVQLSKHGQGVVNLAEYKAVMLASLRSLVPKDWSSDHEVAWGWLWENVERMLKALLGKPPLWEKALAKFVSGLDEEQSRQLKANIYETFFVYAPAGQQWFKQSATRLFFIADRVIQMTMDLYKDPRAMVEEISALGLRHVGYGIPTELFGPFVSCCCKVVASMTSNEDAVEAFSWSLSLVSRILVRTINEGSTLVMKAINANNDRLLRKAVSAAPRSKRAVWVLNITVGTQSISPLYWALESGALAAAEAILNDLLTIRADRDRYYYGADELFTRHPDIIKRLCSDAPKLLPVLFKGLVWRSRLTTNGARRVNYFVKHLIVDAEGKLAPALKWLSQYNDPKVICDPIIILVADLVWGGVTLRKFLYNKQFFMFRAWCLIVAQSILVFAEPIPLGARIVIFLLRCVVYFVNLGRLVYYFVHDNIKDYRTSNMMYVWGVPIPGHFSNWVECANVLQMVMMLGMLGTEPILYCFRDTDRYGIFNSACAAADAGRREYYAFSAVAAINYVVMHCDMTILSTKLAAYRLVCARAAQEVFMFIMAMLFVILAFSCAICALFQNNPRFGSIPTGALSLGKMTLGMYGGMSFKELIEEPVLLAMIFVYQIITWVALLNLLVAQLNCSYDHVIQDAVGYARLNRAKVIAGIQASIAQSRWASFLDRLQLDERKEFNEGDVGLPGAVQVEEPANLHLTTVDQICRFGGSTAAALPWPEDEAANVAEDGFERLENTLQRALKSLSSRSQKGGGGTGSRTDSAGGSEPSMRAGGSSISEK